MSRLDAKPPHDGSGRAGSDKIAHLVTFRLAGEEFGMHIMGVEEIIRIQAITRIPQTPDFIEGVINLRGSVIPVIDLRKRFGLPAKERDNATRIIVVRIAGRVSASGAPSADGSDIGRVSASGAPSADGSDIGRVSASGAPCAGRLLGFIVDSVLEVIKFDESKIEPTPAVLAGVARQYLQGICKLRERLILLLDPAKILMPAEMNAIDAPDPNSETSG